MLHPGIRGARAGLLAVWCVVAPLGCSGVGSTMDAAPEAGLDAGAIDATDSSSMDGLDHAATDAGLDAPLDVTSDAGADTSDANGDATTTDDAQCAAGSARCAIAGGSACVDLTTNPMHCGACGNICCAGAFCAGGACVYSCGAGITFCGSGVDAGCDRPGVCVDLTTDRAHCGSCASACASNEVCVGGTCLALDAGTDAATDAANCAPTTEPPSPGGICDGRGRIACSMWAQASAQPGETAWATCVSATPGCAKADRCSDISNPATCTCGAGPACGANEVCIAPDSTTPPACRCIIR